MRYNDRRRRGAIVVSQARYLFFIRELREAQGEGFSQEGGSDRKPEPAGSMEPLRGEHGTSKRQVLRAWNL